MTHPRITYLTEPRSVAMADPWYDIADSDHFWIRRRFDVMRFMLRHVDVPGLKVAEIGCGHGLVQNQFEQHWGISVDGFDLNESALRNSSASGHRLFCYDIFDRHPEFQARYDLILLFDVLEHAEDDSSFMSAVLFHLAERGSVLVNVPALPSMYSKYDVAAGHYRRYDKESLSRLADRAGLRLNGVSYWGLWLIPLLLLRKLLLMNKDSEQEIIDKGFRPPGLVANEILYAVCGMERLPLSLGGTSLMASFSRVE